MSPNGIELNVIDPELCRIEAESGEYESSPDNTPTGSPMNYPPLTPSTVSSSPRDYEELETYETYSTDGVKYYVEANYVGDVPRVYDENMQLVRNVSVRNVNLTPDTDSQFLYKYIVPNFYSQEHFEEMDDWSDKKVEKFKEFMAKMICAHDPFREIISEYIEHFNEKNQDEEEEESSVEK